MSLQQNDTYIESLIEEVGEEEAKKIIYEV